MTTHRYTTGQWTEVISPARRIFTLDLKEIWRYRDLLSIWMRRDILSIYTQTILGPLWFLLQPLLTTVTYMIIFSRIAKLSTIDLPPVLFYLSGTILWGYFSECILKTSAFLKDNTGLFSKVYFPRLIIPLSIVLTNLVKFGIQLAAFLLVYFYFIAKGAAIHANGILLLLPFVLIMVSGLSLGCGLLVSSLTTRYKDLSHLITFSVQLLLFLSPVFFPISAMENSSYKKLILLNPMTGPIECFRYAFTGRGYFSWSLLGYDALVAAAMMMLGIVVFNAIEKTFVDTI